MMLKLRLLIEYGAYPLWIYDEDGDVLDTDLLPEWQDDISLRQLLDTIQKIYNSLFIDNAVEFSYVGFRSIDEKNAFVDMVREAIDRITTKNAGKYPLWNSIDEKFFATLTVKETF